jgi:DNA-binding CsgD family transcriptional regulator
MTSLDETWARAAVEVSGIAALTDPIDLRARAVLVALRAVVPYEAGLIALRDPERRRQVALAENGDAAALRAYFDSPVADAELEHYGLHQPGPPVLASDVPMAETHAWSEHLLPAGFRAGVAVGLFGDGGRHVGVLGLLTGSATDLTEDHRSALAYLAPLAARAVDRLRSIGTAARMVTDADAGVVLTHRGEVMNLPGRPGHPLLTPSSPVLRLVTARLDTGATCASFLARTAGAAAAGLLVRVTVLECSGGSLDHLRAVVLLSPAGDVHGLSDRELEILGLLADGWPDDRIAAALGTTAAEVAAAADRAGGLLGCAGRREIAAAAIRAGLLLPRAAPQPEPHP